MPSNECRRRRLRKISRCSKIVFDFSSLLDPLELPEKD